MTRKKPPGLSYETWIDKLVREAQERGDFDNLPGAGKPIPDLDANRPHDELWWVKKLLKRENLSLTPATLRVKAELEKALEEIRAATSEERVRRVVADINAKIADANAKAFSGPPSDVAPLDADDIVRQWRAKRG